MRLPDITFEAYTPEEVNYMFGPSKERKLTKQQQYRVGALLVEPDRCAELMSGSNPIPTVSIPGGMTTTVRVLTYCELWKDEPIPRMLRAICGRPLCVNPYHMIPRGPGEVEILQSRNYKAAMAEKNFPYPFVLMPGEEPDVLKS